MNGRQAQAVGVAATLRESYRFAAGWAFRGDLRHVTATLGAEAGRLAEEYATAHPDDAAGCFAKMLLAIA